MDIKIPVWHYKIRTKEGIETGEWRTTLQASQICNWLEKYYDADIIELKLLGECSVWGCICQKVAC